MKTENSNIIAALFAIKFDKELQAILKQDIKALKSKLTSNNDRQLAL